MNFHEYQAKQLFADYGIAVPAGRVASSADEAVEAARLNNIDVASISSRPGWARALKGRGFDVDQVTITKDLRNGA